MAEREITREPYRHGYQGQYAEKDKETGFNFFDLRLYDARIGRTLSPDPYGQFASPYSWVGNNPVSGVDPNGGWCTTCLTQLGQSIQNMMGTMLDAVTVTASRSVISGAVASGAFNVVARSGYQLEFGNISTPSFTIGDNFRTNTPARGYNSPAQSFEDWLKTYNPPSAQIRPWEPSMAQQWGMSESLIGGATYGIADAVILSASFFMPWREATHLDGRPAVGWDKSNAFVTTASIFLPVKGVRSSTAKSTFLKELGASGKAPSWMNQWLSKGKVPPGYNVHHYKPISIGGFDISTNMRLVTIKIHRLIHKFDRRWVGRPRK
jgi:RHS repeat-associated protein